MKKLKLKIHRKLIANNDFVSIALKKSKSKIRMIVKYERTAHNFEFATINEIYRAAAISFNISGGHPAPMITNFENSANK